MDVVAFAFPGGQPLERKHDEAESTTYGMLGCAVRLLWVGLIECSSLVGTVMPPCWLDKLRHFRREAPHGVPSTMAGTRSTHGGALSAIVLTACFRKRVKAYGVCELLCGDLSAHTVRGHWPGKLSMSRMYRVSAFKSKELCKLHALSSKEPLLCRLRALVCAQAA